MVQMKRTALALKFTLALLTLTLAGAFIVSQAKANFFPDPGPDLPRIYIRNDGNIDPATAPIEKTGNLYKLTDNILLHTVEIQRDNVILDGAWYTIQGNASRIKGYDDGNNGIIVVGGKNVNITRLNFEQGDTGVRISESSHVNLINNSFFNGTARGVIVQDSTFVLIEANNFTAIRGDEPSISCSGSENTIRNNIITDSIRGIELSGSSNELSKNRIESILPVIMDNADSNVILDNYLTGPEPSPFLANQTHTGNEGIALFVNCSDNTFIGNSILGFSGQAIRLVFGGSNNTFYGNYFANNQFAIAIGGWVDLVPMNNLFYGNIFAEDSCNIHVSDRDSNFWDNSTMGNYWGNHNGTDSNRDGIGDSAYIINGFKWDTDVDGFVSFVSGQDNYPLMAPYDVENSAIVLETADNFTMTLLIASVTSVTVIGAGLLVFLKKGKNAAELL